MAHLREASAEAMRRHIERERSMAASRVAILKRPERGRMVDFRIETPAALNWPMNRTDNARREINVEHDAPRVAPDRENLIRGRGVSIMQEIVDAYGGNLLFERSLLQGLKARPAPAAPSS